MANEKNGARSYKGEVIGDSYSLTINFKWLIQIICLVAVVTFSFWKIEGRIQELERNLALVTEQIETHNEERRTAEQRHKEEMEEELSLLKTELNINPLSWQWGKKKK